jgi:hypothetical protein
VGTITRAIRLGPTTSEGDFERTVPNITGAVRAIGIVLGTLDTPDITVEDALTEAAILTVEAVAAEARYQPVVPLQDTAGADIEGTEDPDYAPVLGPPVLLRGVTVTVAGGGAATSGVLHITLER